ncbi:protein FAM53A [Artibeus jamaicensis]|uniref:protein FAM53A n=1 Tax=Artibeus jamaicensis TaxID=9417 RepID=UPI00235A8695|nr:protein FAM53A [Artibeus jamaicensis]XP_036982858.2 protein FAM53A [Artibeus jamaicensis]XP_036982859.2 protein FAM53A [Artibeus jamaicensis]XP_036982860.2 protein FAM53A [Artibeus jamaicensis]
MVTLITEKLQSQSLDDLAHKSRDAGPCSAEKPDDRSGPLSPFETCGDRSPGKALSGGLSSRSQATAGPTLPFLLGPCGMSVGLGAVTSGDVRESPGPPSAPPSKRHCRSLSEPDERARCRSPWRPGGSRVWTAVSKRRCHSGGSSCLPGGTCPVASPSSPPGARPASASSSFLDHSGAGAGPPWCRRLSLSQEHLAHVDSPSELGWRLGLLRSRSQPCVLVGRKSQLKRRREEDTRWPRPSLDFLKMTQTLKNSKSLGSLDFEGEDDDDPRAKMAGSCPRDPHGLVTPVSSPCGPREPVASEGRGSGDPSTWDSAEEEGVLPLDPGALDLEQIENN